ncbi:MAG: hypothetical protein IJY99_04265 [Alphaproteobacteria bacterium]|nr:hypothetical protein [Alphaproteobacteria bacterium]
MNKKLILSSLAVLGLVSPALAEPFPSTGYMQENMTYTNAATYENMGVYEDTVNAIAEYTNNSYYLEPGYYLPGNSENQLECPANSYCPGGYEVEYSEHDQGIESCPMGYPFADGGSPSVSATQCYKPCDISAFQNAIALVDGGRDYYATGPDDCKIASCKPGYSIVGRGITGDHILSRVGGQAGTGTAPSNDTWSVDYGQENGILVGDAYCSVQTSGATGELLDVINLESGKACYCNITEYKSTDDAFSVEVGSKWMFVSATSANDVCAKECGSLCAEAMSKKDGRAEYLRNALISQISYVVERCDPNTITITWENADPADVSANNAGSVEYGGDVRTPVKATPVPGKTFKGWRFEKVSQ